MTRFVLTLAAVIAIHATGPVVQAGLGHREFRSHCRCGNAAPVDVMFHGYGIHEGYTRDSYPVSPPANHAYGYVDNSHKPWSLIPGDGYVGATVAKAGKKDKTKDARTAPGPSGSQNKSDALTPLPDTTVPRAPTDSKLPGRSETPEPPRPTEVKDQAQTQTLERNQIPTLYEVPEPNRKVPTPYEPQSDGSTSESLSLPPTPTSAGLVQTLLGFSVVMLGFGGHYARKTSQVVDNEAPIVRI